MMCAETATFDVDNATKNYKKIIDLGLGYDCSIIKTILNYLVPHAAY